MDASLSGALDSDGSCDTYDLWRKPGRYRYEARARGRGAVRLVIEAHQPGGTAGPMADRWQLIAEVPRIGGAPGVSGAATVPEVRLSDSISAEWVRLRVKFSPVPGSGPVGYEFSLRPEP